jgi:hypothetical protein
VRNADADQIARGWTNVTHPGGSFKGMGAPAARQSGGYTVVSVPLTFQAGDATGRVVLSRDGKVTGLTLNIRADVGLTQGQIPRTPPVDTRYADAETCRP